MSVELTIDALARLLKDTVAEVQEEPEFQRASDSLKFVVDENGEPAVKLSVANVPLDYDLWRGLRNPAMVGLYPVGLPEIWDYYANRRKRKVDEAGRPSIFQVPRTYDYARDNYRRAVIVTVMLPFSNELIHGYVADVIDKRKGSSHSWDRMYKQVNDILDRAVTRAAIEMVTDESERVIVAMNGTNITAVSKESVPETHQGGSHGPSKGGNYPHKSIAALTGLGQFGVSRIIFRDELEGNRVRRFTGPIRSIIIFDTEEVVKDGSGGVMYPSQDWRDFLMPLFDFTNIDPEVNRYRFCTYIPMNDKGCGKCIEHCPSGAQPSSTPGVAGDYSEQVARQGHRFWDNKLQFDFGKCTDERGQMAGILSEWSCARCLTVCVDRGIMRKAAVKEFYEKMAELTMGKKTAKAAA